jgi:hypothetical protein
VAGADGGPLLQVVVAGRAPLLAWYEAAWTPAPPAAPAEGTPAGGGWLQLARALVSAATPSPPPLPASPVAVLDDPARALQALLPSPLGHLALAADGLGRVLLLDVRQQCVVRLWKGYRDAQIAFLGARHAVLYAARRGLLEIWSLRHGPRLAAYSEASLSLQLPDARGSSQPMQMSGSAVACSAAFPKGRRPVGRGRGPRAAFCCTATRD